MQAGPAPVAKVSPFNLFRKSYWVSVVGGGGGAGGIGGEGGVGGSGGGLG
jgi:hypothetical protein